MATMIKEKRREKKKSKEKQAPRTNIPQEQPNILNVAEDTKDPDSLLKEAENVLESSQASAPKLPECSTKEIEATSSKVLTEKTDYSTDTSVVTQITDKIIKSDMTPQEATDISVKALENNNLILTQSELTKNASDTETYENLNRQLHRMSIPEANVNLPLQEQEKSLGSQQEEIKQDTENKTQENEATLTPSAPVLVEVVQRVVHKKDVVVTKEIAPKVECMPLEEAMRVYGGAEMAEVRAMAAREEAIVEAGPVSGPDHPLVDLLSTFRCSLIAVERERTQLACKFADEEKYRNTLWKIEKKHSTVMEKCPCGQFVELKANYEQAELLTDKMPIAKMKLEGLLRDVQDSYCHHQHAALLAHCQIEDFISETIQSNKPVIREALALILQALRLSDGAPAALAIALQRWAAALSAALLDGRDLRQLLYLLHQLFRQTRSVRWAAELIRMSVVDGPSAAEAIAVLELLLARPGLEPALECTEDTEEAWEEVGRHGAGAVSEGALRERDLLALLRAMPLRALAQRLTLFTRADVRNAREHEWGDGARGRGVLTACCGVRVLLHVMVRAHTAHPAYRRLRRRLRALAGHLLHALGALHEHARNSYYRELTDKIAAELEAAFATGFALFGESELHKLPTTLLTERAAREYCIALIVGLHDKSPKKLDSISIELPVLPCEERVRIVVHAALDRVHDHELARIVLEFLFQIGIKRKTTAYKGTCDVTARELMPRLLAAHPYLYTAAFHILADLHQAEPLDPSCLEPLAVRQWRPTAAEALVVLGDWARRCNLLQHLLPALHYSAPDGISLETQLAIGLWLVGFVRDSSAPAPEWAWLTLRRLRVHATDWSVGLDAPPPHPEPDELFGCAYAVLSSAWGHCIPLICSRGVAALCRVAAARPGDAARCLAPVMLVMAQSPESVSLTPQFSELFAMLLSSGPTLVQRALGRGPTPGAELLLRILLEQLESKLYPGISRAALVSAWLHALWRPALPASGLLDAALLACREWTQYDAHAAILLQEENYKEHISYALRNVAIAPSLCECMLRNAHAHREARRLIFARLLDVLHLQRVAGDRIHVDNALKQIGANMSSEELAIYRVATAVLSAPAQHPSHLTLWRLFFHLYLQRPPVSMQESTPPIGPLFFSGLIKSRTLGQLRKRLQETATFHHSEAETLKNEPSEQQTESTTKIVKSNSTSTDDKLLPELTIADLTGESSGSDSESEAEESESEEEKREESVSEVKKERDVKSLLCYHVAAEKMVREYSRWLEEGDKVRAMPHHADIARFIPEDALEAAWAAELLRRRQIAAEQEPPPPPPPTPPATPFQIAVNRILKIRDRSHKRIRKPEIKSPVDNVNFRDLRTLITSVDRHLVDIEKLAQEWSSEVRHVSTLDAELWGLVRALRVRRWLPPVRRSCSNRCQPLVLVIQEYEWCISTGAETGIKENRRCACAGIRRLSRARPHAARTAAALHAIARRVSSPEAARRVAERAWRCAASAAGCAPAAHALSALVGDLAEKWLCHDGRICSELLKSWSGKRSSALQQALCGSLVAPRRLRATDWPQVYTALLQAELPSHAVFSYLSKFELNRWAETATPAQRTELLEALLAAAQRWGPVPDEEYHMLLELIGVHSCALITAQEICAHSVRCARAAAAGRLPGAHWPHVVLAAERSAALVPFDQLGHVLRELGVVWWEARAGLQAARVVVPFAEHAPHVAALLLALVRAFVASAVALSYAPERVSWYAWSALQEAWAAWVRPHSAPPLLPSMDEREAYTPMLTRFVNCLQQAMAECPGTEEYLLEKVFEWTIETHASVSSPGASQESRVQLSALLAALAQLPWTQHQWLHAGLQHALQVCSRSDKEITSWCSEVWRGLRAETWLRGAEEPAPRLAALLYLFTSMPQHHQTLEEAARLPWWRLPDVALDEALERFFAQYFDPAQAYHDLPAFRVVMSASELCAPLSLSLPLGAVSRSKRVCCMSQCVRAAAAPALASHVPAHVEYMLRVITQIGPHLESSPGELEELLGRAVLILCMEPAASAALPVWQRWVSSAPPRLVSATLTAAAILTAFEQFAALADSAARAHLAYTETTGWSEIAHRWEACPWADPGALCARGRLHAAYGVTRVRTAAPHGLRTALLALLAADIDFIADEVIVAVWICYAGRCAREWAAGASAEQAECAGAARGVLTRWGAEPRRSLLRAVTMQADTQAPTAQHRLLCRLAQCILTPNTESAIRAYEASCTAVLGSNSDVITWGKAPHPKRLPRLAIRLYPNAEKYFQEELNLSPEDL